MHQLESLFSLLKPYFSPAYVWAERGPLLETVEIAAGGMLFALAIGLALALIIGARLPGSRLLYSSLIALRSIPDLTLAIVCVMLVGLGPAAGMLAIAIYYGAAMGKVGGDLFLSADPGPVESLRATGARQLTVAFYGLLPLRLKDLLTYGAYDFECAMRAAVIVGAVGAGGLGTELVSAINQYDYGLITMLVTLLVLLIAVFDALAALVRKYPALLLAFTAGGAFSAWINRPRLFAFSHTAVVLTGMWPPHLLKEQVFTLPSLIGETLAIALGGTALAVVFALPLGALAARNLAPAVFSFPARRLLEFLRAVPEVVWGLLLVCAAVIGPRAGMLALALHSTGVFGKLYAESIENVAPEPVMALETTGGARIAIAGFGLMPLAFPPMAIHTLFRFEWNIRAAAIVGMIGAGGIGQALYNSQQLMFYDQTLAYVLITAALVLAVDFANTQLRKRWKIAEEQV
ncbi:MAG TPA: ABC transporter permease subunit [Candidatus Angelobacter sp.]|nr:ABC transporter permease subunit [Candidatus Angelobacter sp.]